MDNSIDLTTEDISAAEIEVGRLILEAGTPPCFGVIRIELEANNRLARLSAAEFARLGTSIVQLLRDSLRPADRIFTEHGWSWIVVLPKLTSPEHLTLALVKLLRNLEEHRNMAGPLAGPIMPVLGAAFYPDSAEDVHGLLAMARMASFDAWRTGVRFQIGMPDDDSYARQLSDLAARIPVALQSDLLEIRLQPQVRSQTGECTAVEVLLRWQDGENNWIPPLLIIAAIERAGVRPAFNRWLIQRALRCAKELDALGIEVNYSINLVAADIHDPELVDVVRQAMLIWDFDCSRITFEITETAMVREDAATQDNLQRLKDLGLRLALDDFGTGFSAMDYLRRLPIDELKIDQVFVRRMTESGKDREIVSSMIHLAHQLGITVVAEGVEDEPTRLALRDLGCDLIQGYHYSPPIEPAAFAQWWKNRLTP